MNKDRYEKKAQYVERKLGENMQVDTLTEEQHLVINDICRIRHKMHCNQDSFYNTESQYYDEFWKEIDGGINDRITSVGLPAIKFEYDEFGMPTDIDYLDMGYEDYDSAIEYVYDVVEGFNDTIEAWLREIDRVHGTKYAPTGFARLKI